MATLATMYIAGVPEIHLWPNGPSTKCSRSVATVTYAYRVVGIMREQMSSKVKKIVRASVSNGHASSSEVPYKCINEGKIKFSSSFKIYFYFTRHFGDPCQDPSTSRKRNYASRATVNFED